MPADRLTGEAARGLYEEALAVESPEQLDALWDRAARFAPHVRPVGDRWGNRGLFTAAGGNFDHKLTELITNMIDSVLLRQAVDEHGAEILGWDEFPELFETPAAAVHELFGAAALPEAPGPALVELRSAGPDRKRERTIVFRDLGIGMEPDDISRQLLRVGSSRKDGVLWLMGAFGRGGLTVLPNAHGLVVLSRSALAPTEGVVLTIVRWKRVGNRQTETALYQVVSPWNDDGDRADPLVLPVAACPGFDCGTRVAVVGFRSEGIWVTRLGDERSLDTIVDTRLFEPPLPVHITAPALGEKRGSRSTQLRGLGRRLAGNPRLDRVEGSEQLPFRYGERTYQLPVRFYLFASDGDAGTRRRFVARRHAVLLNSNGQVHAHWTPDDFRNRTRLNKLHNRILVVLDTDPLPLELRTSLFTADRTDLLRNPDAVRLEEELVAFLDDWDDLDQANSDMIRESIRRSNRGRSTAALSDRIARAADARAWRTAGGSGGERRKRRPPRPVELLDDPTTLAGPQSVKLVRGRTRGIHYAINARDGFIPARAECRVTTTHLDIAPEEDLTVGELRSGRIRVSIAVPADADLGTATLTVRVESWPSMHGGLKEALETETSIEIVDEKGPPEPRPPDPPNGRRVSGPAPIHTTWTTHEEEPTWKANTPGELEMVGASVLAELGGECERFSVLDGDVHHIKLNGEFAPLKAYTSSRARSVGNEGVARARDRYALGLGVYMLLAHEQQRLERESGHPVDEDAVAANCRAAAQGVLAVLPDFDTLIAEAGLDGL